jgi:hypothetical protein
MNTLSIKKPQYLGTAAQIIAAKAEAGTRGLKSAQRNGVARAAVGREFLNRPVTIVRIGGLRHVLVDEIVPSDVEVEDTAVICFVGKDGGIVVSFNA